jgi:predicted amino acid racemase
MPTSSGLPTSNNWCWAEILKTSFTLVELGPLHKNGLPSRNKSDNTLKKVSDNTLKIRSEWQHTQEKVSATAQERFTRRVYHQGSSWENKEKLDWA